MVLDLYRLYIIGETLHRSQGLVFPASYGLFLLPTTPWFVMQEALNGSCKSIAGLSSQFVSSQAAMLEMQETLLLEQNLYVSLLGSIWRRVSPICSACSTDLLTDSFKKDCTPRLLWHVFRQEAVLQLCAVGTFKHLVQVHCPHKNLLDCPVAPALPSFSCMPLLWPQEPVQLLHPVPSSPPLTVLGCPSFFSVNTLVWCLCLCFAFGCEPCCSVQLTARECRQQHLEYCR